MSDYRTKVEKFILSGLMLNKPVDLLDIGEYTILRNVRSFQKGVIQPRAGLSAINAIAIADLSIHSCRRLNDDTPTASQSFTRILGSGSNLYSDNSVHNTFTARAGGFSGNPISIIPFRPNSSPAPYAYIGDSTKMGKLKVDGTFRNLGIAPPSSYPTGPGSAKIPALNSFQSTIVDSGINTAAGWTVSDSFVLVSNGVGPTDTISGIVYDSGSTGWANVAIAAPGSTLFYQVGYMLATNSSVETIILDSVYTPIKTTTISSITYDSGTTGLCTIVLAAYKRKALVPNTTILINGTEYVRVLSVTFGEDDLPSLRCSTVVNHVAGESITGVLSFRAFFSNTHAAGETFTWRNIGFRGAAIPAGTSAVAIGNKVTTLDLSSIGGRPVQDADELNFIIFIDDVFALDPDKVPLIQEIQIQIDIDDGSFTRNYYYIAIRLSDITSVIGSQQTLQDARTNRILSDGVGETPLPTDESSAQLRERLQRRLAKAQKNGNSDRVRDILARIADLDRGGDGDIDGGGSGGGNSGGGGGISTGTYITLGVSSYIPVRLRISELNRIGSDLSKTLANVNAIRLKVLLANKTITNSFEADFNINISSFWVGGAFGPDAGEIGIPYLYRYRYRASESGAKSYPSPSTRSGVIARRQRVQLSAAVSTDPQVDKIDWFRFGGSLGIWKYIGTGPNTTVTFNDDFPDDVIAGNEELKFDSYQPFPIVSTPILGTCSVSGTMVTITSGAISTATAPGTPIIINGMATSLYSPPLSTTKFEVLDNLGALANVSLFIPEPTLMAQALPALWGTFGDGETGVVMFACGDSINSGTLYWTNPDDPDMASERNQLEVCNPSEALINGFIYNSRAFVFSTENLYAIYPTRRADGSLGFSSNKTPLNKGIAGRYFFCTSENGIYFGDRDGIYFTQGGSAISITDYALFPLFPHEGLVGTTTYGTVAPDFSLPNFLRLSYYEGYLYFNYSGVDGNRYTLVFDENSKGWILDSYTPQINLHYGEEGRVNSLLLCGRDGRIYLYGGTADSTSAPAAIVPIPCQVRVKAEDFGDFRNKKIIGDVAFDSEPATQLTTQIYFDNYSIIPSSTNTIPVAVVRNISILEINAGAGGYAKNVGIDISWSSTSIPKLYGYSYSWIPKPEDTKLRAFQPDGDNAGVEGAKWFQGFLLRANSYNETKEFKVQADNGIDGLWTDIQSFSGTDAVNFVNESTQAFSFTTPFIAHNVRILALDDSDWTVIAVQWIFEPEPELVTEWIAQPTAFGMRNFGHLFDAYIAMRSTAITTLKVYIDNVEYILPNIPSTGGALLKIYVQFPAVKGKIYQWSVTGDTEFRVYQKDIEVRIKEWGSNGEYQIIKPFGFPHHLAGALI